MPTPFRQDARWWQTTIVNGWRALQDWVRAEPVVAGGVLLAGAFCGLVVNHVVGPQRFRASAIVTVATSSGIQFPSSLTALAASAGVQLGANTPPLAFQSSLFESDPFRDSLLLAPLELHLADCPAEGPCRLFAAFGPAGAPTARHMQKARERLSRRLDDIRDERSQTLTIACQHEDSTTARETVETSIALLDRTNKRLMVDAAQARVAFLSGQEPRLVQELHDIQDSLERFYRSNVSIGTSPELRFREERLRTAYQAQSDLLQGVRSQLAQNEIQARGNLQLVQEVFPAVVDPKPVRPLRNLALLLSGGLFALLRYGFWRRRTRLG